jgi:hypothetical protein
MATPNQAADAAPVTDEREPAEVISAAVERVLDLAATWTAWDGRPSQGDERVYTPHKAIRRVADHLLDHLAEVEARLARQPSLPDAWHASAVTTLSDLAPFSQVDLDEARSRLTRLAQLWRLRLSVLPAEVLDCAEEGAWTLRQVAFHAAESTSYAEAVGRLPNSPPGTSASQIERNLHEEGPNRAKLSPGVIAHRPQAHSGPNR